MGAEEDQPAVEPHYLRLREAVLAHGMSALPMSGPPADAHDPAAGASMGKLLQMELKQGRSEL